MGSIREDLPPAAPPQGPPVRETGIAQVMTSTSVGKHPTAFHATGLPILQVALNVGLMSANLGPLLAPLARTASPPAVIYAKLLAYKQGNRGTVRYEVDGIGDSRTIVLGKLYPQVVQAQRVERVLQALWGEVFAGDDGLGVPRPLGCIPELSMLVYIPVEGEPLDEVLPRDGSTRPIELTAAWLRALHQARLSLDRRLQMATELVNVEAWAALVGQAYPDEAAGTASLAAGLRAAAASSRFRTDTPIHKDFHYKHVIVDGGLRVIDFDEVRLGDPMYDVAHFCAHLRLLALRTVGDPAGFTGLEQAFLRAYGGDLVARDERFSWFATYTCLKIAKQLCTVRGVRPRPDGEERHHQVRVMLDQARAYWAALPGPGGGSPR